MAENLLRDARSNLDQADLRLLLSERIGPPRRPTASPSHFPPIAKDALLFCAIRLEPLVKDIVFTRIPAGRLHESGLPSALHGAFSHGAAT
jgi:hypothetical protein